MKELFIKYINRECSEEEIQQIVSYFQHSDDFSEVPTIEAISQLLEDFPDMDEDSVSLIRSNILKIARDEKAVKIKRRRITFMFYAAAVFVGVVAMTYVFKESLFNPNSMKESVVESSQTIPGTDKATLTLEDGSQIALEKNKNFKTQNAVSNGETIVYTNSDKNKTAIVYNTLTIPRGGQFYVELSDGTKVWLNSASQLKYPVTFGDDKPRSVELLYGEAYFEVSPSSKHNGQGFSVFTASQEVKVLGTEFNIKAYSDEDYVYTTLVNGSIALNVENQTRELLPKQQSIHSSKYNVLKVVEADVYSEISWKNGLFSFKSKSLKEIMTVLSRWYDIDVIFEIKEPEKLCSTGYLRRI